MLNLDKLFDLSMNSISIIIIIISIITMLIITLAISIPTVIISSAIIALLVAAEITKFNIIEAVTGTSKYMDALQRRGVC